MTEARDGQRLAVAAGGSAEPVQVEESGPATREEAGRPLELTAILDCHLEEVASVKECLDDRAGDREPPSVVLRFERLARTLRQDRDEPLVERSVGGERLQCIRD